MKKKIATVLAGLALLTAGLTAALALPASDVTSLTTIRQRATAIRNLNASLSAQVPAADKTSINAAAQSIINTANRLLASPTPSPSPSMSPSPSPMPGGTIEIAAAGDIANSGGGDTLTSNLVLALNPDLVLTLGDLAYPDGTASNYSSYYAPTWGRFKNITMPAAGNHDWHTSGAAGYVNYFGTTPSIHSRVVGNWLIVSLDSENVGAQPTALAALLSSDNHPCELLYWHHPRYSSSSVHGSSTRTEAFWATAQANGVDVILSGHDHTYERFGIQRGIRQFVVGTGGAGTYPFGSPVAASEVRMTGNGNWGVIDMMLGASSYSWQFIRATGGAGTVADSGSTACHS